MKVLLVSAEVAPFAKVGGLADVAGSLPKALAELGLDIRVIMPKYPQVVERAPDRWRALAGCPVHMAGWTSGCALDEYRLPGSDVPIYFVEHNDYFNRPYVYGPPGSSYSDNLERLTFLCRTTLAVLEPLNWQPDVIHLNDWHTSLIAVYLKQPGAPAIASVFTAHNLGADYQGIFGTDRLPSTGLTPKDVGVALMLQKKQINLARAGLACADMVNTVSEEYAREILTQKFGPGVNDLVKKRGKDVWGILNGIDYDTWNPATDPALAAHFSAQDLSGKAACKRALQQIARLPVDDKVPVIGMVTRLDAQKGLDLVASVLPQITHAQLVILGTGDHRLETVFGEAAAKRTNIAAFIAFDDKLARQIYAGADMFLMPSRYEPCGLGQMIALAYGTVPVVRATGGLDDTIQEKPAQSRPQNGFKFAPYTTRALLDTINRAVGVFTREPDRWRQIVANAFASDFSWHRSAARYVELYQAAVSKRSG